MSEVIYKDAVIDVIRKNHHRLEGCGLTEEILIEQIQALPSADRPQGQWIHDYHFGLALPEHKCSVCGEWEYSDTESNYCPCCGARMKGADDE